MKQKLQIKMEPTTEGCGWLGFQLCGTIDDDGRKHDFGTLLLRADKRTIKYCPGIKDMTHEEPEPYICEMHEFFDSSSVQSAMASLTLWHRDFLNTHGITIPAYDIPPVESIELPPEFESVSFNIFIEIQNPHAKIS